MIKIENTQVCGWDAAIRGMRNPMNSWDKSDSGDSYNCGKCGRIEREGFCHPKEHDCEQFREYFIGSNDHELMMKLARNGSVHAKYRRMIVVYADVTAPLYWWKEADTYKVGTVANSCSTMHKIAAKEFELDDFSHEHLDDELWIETVTDVMDNMDDIRWFTGLNSLKTTIAILNAYRGFYNACKDPEEKKKYWWQMIQLLPSSYNQKRTLMLNYEVLANIYPSRKDHKLDEWHDFCDWIKSLPYSEIITGENS